MKPVSTGPPEVKETEENSKTKLLSTISEQVGWIAASYQEHQRLPGKKMLNVLKEGPLLGKAQSTGTAPAAGTLRYQQATAQKIQSLNWFLQMLAMLINQHWQLMQITVTVATSQRLTAHPKINENKTGWQHNSCTHTDDTCCQCWTNL